MSTSRFLLLIGQGDRYGGEGLHEVSQALTFYDDKCVWVLRNFMDSDNRIDPYRSDKEHIFDDAFLLMTANVLVKHIYHDDKLNEFAASVKNALENELPLENYYEENRKLMREYSPKIVAVSLACNSMQIGGVQSSGLNDEFLKTVEDYGLKDVELCESVFSRSHGAFDE